MKKAASKLLMTAIVFSSFLILTPNGHANSASVKINNSINTSTNTTSTSNCKTEVHIESNGETKEYKSEDCGSVDIESSDGNSSVKVNTNSNSNPTSTVTQKPSNSPTPTLKQNDDNHASGDAQQEVENIREKQRNFFEKLEEMIKDFFQNLF